MNKKLMMKNELNRIPMNQITIPNTIDRPIHSPLSYKTYTLHLWTDTEYT